MSYQVRRVDPFWMRHPAVVVLAVGGGALAVAGGILAKLPLAVGGLAAAAIGIFLLTKPVISIIFWIMGLLGGLFTFILFPNVQIGDMSWALRGLSAALFSVLYMGIFDAVLLVAAWSYNLLSLFVGGIHIELEEGTSQEG